LIKQKKASSEKIYSNLGNAEVLRLVPRGAGKVLDLGCGAGDNAKLILESNASAIIHGVTISIEEKFKAERYCGKVVVHNLEHGLPINDISTSYEVVLASHVLEHICYPSALFVDVKQVLAPDGLFIVALPNLMYWRYRLRLCLGVFEYTDTGVMDFTHFRWYTFLSAQRILTEHGFCVISREAVGGFVFGPFRRFLHAGLVKRVDRLACGMFPGLFGTQMIFIAKHEKK
jgi:predicted TPR repeat methyltransferase